MIFEELYLKNFGIYRGEHSVDLRVSPEKPVILFGALNGGGKTTFLDAIQLVLYGKHAKCSNRPGTTYGKFLALYKNRYAPSNEISQLQLSFSHRSDNIERHFRVLRTWEVRGDESKDNVTVYCDHEYDPHLSAHWDDFVNEFIPLSLSDLFFFDGEKIENLAQPQRSSELIRTGIESLLGLDLLSQLQIDLSQQDKKRRSENIVDSVKDSVSACEAELSQLIHAIAEAKKEQAELESNISELKIKVNNARAEVRSAGAHLIDQRDELKYQLGAVESQLKLNKSEQVKLAAGVRPLGLIQHLLNDTQAQLKLEAQAKNSQALSEEINRYERDILAVLEAAPVPAASLAAVQKTMADKAEARAALCQVECYLNAENSIFHGLDERLSDEEQQHQQLKSEVQDLLKQQNDLQKQLESIPNYDSVQHLLQKLAEHEAELHSVESRHQLNAQQLQQAEQRKITTDQRYTNLLTQQNKESFEQQRSIQVSEHVDTIKDTLRGFAEQLVQENIERLQDLIKEKFDLLGRKDHLISKLTISPTNFRLTLYGSNGQPLESGRLSAGERQLLAVAILWGLAEASGKELPTVIDTPLGRLDGKHRSQLIEHYFPFAGRQVLLLSTDEEIVGNYYDKLLPHVQQQYHIHFDDQAHSSMINTGYFA